jgi:glycosyltransferase involved in cell wall biosynthesis
MMIWEKDKNSFMNILYDAQIYLEQKAGGISRYHYELTKGMCQLGCKTRIAGLFVKNQYLLSDNQLRKSFIYDPTASFALFNKLILKRALKRMQSDTVFHPANAYRHIISEITEVKNMVFTIHDMIVEKQNKSLGADKVFYAQQASKIIAVSEATKKDIVTLWGITPDKIEVIYHGSSLNPQRAKKPAKPLPDDFLLYVGQRGGYKNFAIFVQAVTHLLKKDSRLYLVCAGKSPFSQEEFQRMKELEIEKKVLFFASPDDSELAYLYSRAKAFVFPSLNEGFGIPILEAWSCGTPIVLSHNDCFTEIVAEAGHYFDPFSVESMQGVIEKVLFDRDLQKDLVRKGASRLSLFSWEKAVLQTYNLYESLL